MFATSSSSIRGARASRPGLMSTSRPEEQLKTFLMIVSGCSLVGLFALVVIRSQLLVAVTSLGDDLDVQKQLVTDMRKRLSDTTNQLNSERRRLEDLTIQRNEEHAEATHTIEVLHEKLDHSKNHLNFCQDDHADARGTSEHMQRELSIEIEECRADVTDLQKDLSTVQRSLKKQQSETLEWKEAYDDEFKTHAKMKSSLTDLRAELRECKDASNAARAAQHHGHPPAPTGTVDAESRSGIASETAGPPGETQSPKRRATASSVGSGPQHPSHTDGDEEYQDGKAHAEHSISEDTQQRAHRNHDFDDDLLDQPHYHHEPHEAPPEVLDGHQGQADPAHDHAQHDHGHLHLPYDPDYELMHHHYHHMHGGHDHYYDESHTAMYQHDAHGDARPQPEHPEEVEAHEAQEFAGHDADAGELPPEESLRIHKMRRRTPPAVETDHAEEQETLS